MHVSTFVTPSPYLLRTRSPSVPSVSSPAYRTVPLRACSPPPDSRNQRPPSLDEKETKPNITPEEYFKRLRELAAEEATLSNPLGLKKSYEIVRFDEDGMGPRDRYVYVEEMDCIGCTHCASAAPGTFFLEKDYGRARVFDQTGEPESIIETAIDCCPVNCIYYVSWDDLVTLENRRETQEINNWARLVGVNDWMSSQVDSAKKTSLDSGIMRCTDCPHRGCAKCPLYGVGENPEYLRKKSMREARKRNKGKGGDSKRTRRRV